MLYKQEGPCLHEVLKRVEPKSDPFSVFDCHQVLHAVLCSLQSTSVCYLSESPWWPCKVGLIHHFTDDKNKVQGGESACPKSLPTTNIHTFTKPSGSERFMNPRTEIPLGQRQKVLAWPGGQPTHLGSVWFCAQLTAVGFEEVWLRALGGG